MSPMKNTGPTYWRSLDELAQTPEFQGGGAAGVPRRRFRSAASGDPPPVPQGDGRLDGHGGLTACRWPKEEIVPFAHRPDGRTPGVPQHFATAMELGGAALGMLVTSYDGRPIKAEGNPLHPDSLGALSAVAQAEILQLYDPDRSRRLLLRESGQEYVKTWSDFESVFKERLAGGGSGVAVLSGHSSSPTRAALKERFLAANPGARWFEYEPVSRDNEREGMRLAFGTRPPGAAPPDTRRCGRLL